MKYENVYILPQSWVLQLFWSMSIWPVSLESTIWQWSVQSLDRVITPSSHDVEQDDQVLQFENSGPKYQI